MFVAAIPTVGCRSQTCYCGTCCTASRLYKAPVGLDAHVLEAQCLGVRYPPRGDHASIHLKQKQPDTTTGRHVKQLPHEAQRSHQSRTARCQRITFKLQTANELQLQSIALTLTLYKIYIYYIYIYTKYLARRVRPQYQHSEASAAQIVRRSCRTQSVFVQKHGDHLTHYLDGLLPHIWYLISSTVPYRTVQHQSRTAYLDGLNVFLGTSVDHLDRHRLLSRDARDHLRSKHSKAVVYRPSLDQQPLRQSRDLAVEGRHQHRQSLIKESKTKHKPTWHTG